MTDKKVDEDWKKRAQAEKEVDAVKADGTAPRRRAARPGAEFLTLVETLASQALLFMGAMPDPMTGQAHQDLQQAQTMIDLLDMLEEKTKGNLDKQESEQFRRVLDELRVNFVRLTSPQAPRAPRPPQPGI